MLRANYPLKGELRDLGSDARRGTARLGRPSPLELMKRVWLIPISYTQKIKSVVRIEKNNRE
jgi:hypothetical protein